MVPKWLMYGALILSPVVIGAATVMGVGLITGLRRGFGAFNGVPPAALVGAAVFIVVHGGFFAAPFLVAGGRRPLALWLTAPLSVIATLLVLVAVVRVSGEAKDAAAWLVPLLLGVLVAGYWLPVGAMVLG